MTSNIANVILLILFFFSGVSGLIYEIAWMRELNLIFGCTTSAISTVLTVFFSGLALGSIYFGKAIDKKTAVIRVYGLLELGIGIYCMITPMLFEWVESLYVFIFKTIDVQLYPQLLIRFAFCFIILIIPTTLMGGTLPVLSRYFVSVKGKTGESVGQLYSVNTLGAVTGCFIAGFFLIKAAGLTNTIYIAAIINLFIGISSFLIRPDLLEKRITIKDTLSPSNGINVLNNQRLNKIVLLVFALSGFASMAYEVFWARMLIMIIGSTTYAFAVLLVVFLTGIALGSLVFSKFADSNKNLLLRFSMIEIFIGISAFLTIPVLGISHAFSQYLLSEIQRIVRGPWITFTILQFVVSALIIFIPAFLMGATFPLISGLYNRHSEQTGSNIGKIYSFNTFGGIAGSFAGGFLMIPFFGTFKSLMSISLLSIFLGLCLLFNNRLLKFNIKILASFCVILLCIVGIFIVPQWQQGIFLGINRPSSSGEKVIFHKEGIGGTAAVTHIKGNKTLFINGESESSTEYYSLMTQYLLGYLPLLLHPEPQSVLEIGLGGGITLGTTVNYAGFKEIDSVEIIGAAKDAALLFERENNYVLANPKVNLIINDGRNYLLLTKKKYDVITGNTIHPWRAGAANILSKEYFNICREHLNRDGVVTQWVPLQFMHPEDLKSIIKTFNSVFPYTSIWFSNMDIFLVGSMEKLTIDFERLNKVFYQDKIRNALNKVDIDSPYALLSRFVMNERRLKEYIGDNIPIISDDHPLLEFSAPKSRHIYTLANNLTELIGYRNDISSLLPDENTRTTNEANKYYDAMTHNILGIIEENRQRQRDALKEYRNAIEINPNDNIARHNAAKIYTAEGFQYLYKGKFDEAVSRFNEALSIYPTQSDAHFALSDFYINKGLLAQAAEEIKNVLVSDPGNARAHNNLGGIYGLQGLHESAFLEFKIALESDPYHISSYNNLASYYLRYKKDRNKALPYLRKSLEIDPLQERADWIRTVLGDTE